MNRLRWGILATGRIARAFAQGLKGSKTGELVAVGSRELASAEAFAQELGGRPHGSYEALLADPEVDVVYIATPHHLHVDNVIAAARAGKGILCEKPFTLTAEEAERALAAVREAGVFFMEAFMYRCHPQTHWIRETLAAGAIGVPRAMHAEFSFNASRDWDNFRLDGSVGGGGLMDVGTYCASYAQMVAGGEPEAVEMHAQFHPERGYDEYGMGLFRFESGFLATFLSGVHLQGTNDVRIYGDAGTLIVSSPWQAWPDSHVTLLRNGQDPEVRHFGSEKAELYALEADAVARYWEAGECPWMTSAETLANMRTLDRLRARAWPKTS